MIAHCKYTLNPFVPDRALVYLLSLGLSSEPFLRLGKIMWGRAIFIELLLCADGGVILIPTL